MSIAYLFLGPKPFNGWALSHRSEFELVSGPRTDFRCNMPVPLLPHHWPKHPEELGNFIIPFCSRTGYEQENWGLGITSAPLGNNCQEVSGILTTVFGFIASCYNRVSLCMRTGAGE